MIDSVLLCAELAAVPLAAAVDMLAEPAAVEVEVEVAAAVAV